VRQTKEEKVMVTVIFSTEKDLVSGTIRAFTWSSVSHVDIRLPAGLKYGNGRVTENGDLVGARFAQDKGLNKGVSVRPWNYHKTSKEIWTVSDTTPETDAKIYEAALSQVGKPYDLSGIANFALHRDWREEDSFFCSELVAWAFEQAGAPLLNGNCNRITPGMLLMSPLLKVVAEKR
jgi:hypothetical protein